MYQGRNDYETLSSYRDEPMATYKSNTLLTLLRILYNAIIGPVLVLAIYSIIFLITKKTFFDFDPAEIFRKYWMFIVLIILVLSTLWTLWFNVATVYAYSDRMIIKKRGRKWLLLYNAIICFEMERTVLIFIPTALDKTIVANGSKRMNLVKKCSLLSKEDFVALHQFVNDRMPQAEQIPMRSSTTFHA